MNEPKMSTDIITAIISVILCIIVIVLSLTLTVLVAFKSLVTPLGMHSIFKNMGYDILASEYKGLDKGIEKLGFSGENAKKFLKTDAMKEICGLYGEDVYSVLMGEEDSKSKVNVKNVQKALVNNLDELLEIQIDDGMKEEKILEKESSLISSIKNNSDLLVKSFPTKNETKNDFMFLSEENIVSVLFDPAMLAGLITLIITLFVGLLALRYYNFGGFVWISVSYIIVGVVIAIFAILSLIGLFDFLLLGIVEQGVVFVAIRESIAFELIVGSVICFAIAIFLLALRKFFKKLSFLISKIKLNIVKTKNSHFNEKRS